MLQVVVVIVLIVVDVICCNYDYTAPCTKLITQHSFSHSDGESERRSVEDYQFCARSCVVVVVLCVGVVM